MPPTYPIRPELLRQRGRLVGLLEKLDAKNCDKAAANARLLARRKSYVPKNNGKGRPAKKLKLMSKDDEARRQQYVAEIRLLDDILAGAPDHSIVAWLQAALEPTAAVDQPTRFRQAKIAKLLRQFGADAIDLRTPREWSRNDVRAFLQVAKQRQAARLDYFRRVPVHLRGEQECEERERAAMLILERLLCLQHVQTAADFLSYVESMRLDGPPAAPNLTLTKRVWGESLDALVSQIAKRFQLPQAVI